MTCGIIWHATVYILFWLLWAVIILCICLHLISTAFTTSHKPYCLSQRLHISLESMGDWSSTEEGISVYFVIFSSLLALVLILSKFLRDHVVLASLLPEVGMILLVGIIAGSFVNWFAEEPVDEGDEEDVIKSLLSFSPNVFFIALLPPIIFNSGYHLRRELFFRHFTPICLFACIGTLVSAVVIALILKAAVHWELTGTFYPTLTELFTFGALISATDPVSTLAVFQSKRVDPHLFYLVFGESVLNDAVGLVLFNAFAKFVHIDNGFGKVAVGIFTFFIDFTVDFICSSLLGFLSGMLAALLLKKVDMRKTSLLELSLYILIMYVPYLLAEIMKMSGIVTILFTGMAARRYCVPNLSLSTQTNADVFFRLAAHIAEVAIFLELGLSVFTLFAGEGNFQWRFILWSILACLIGRAVNVYPITHLFNRSLRDEIPLSTEEEDEKSEFGHVEMIELEEEETKDDSGVDIRNQTTMTPESRRDLKIGWNTAHMLWFSGLRGAVAYACVRSFPDTFQHQTEFVVVTMAIVLVTVFFLGGTTELMLKFLKIDMNVDEDKYTTGSSREHLVSGFMHGFEKDYVRSYVIRDFNAFEPVAAGGNIPHSPTFSIASSNGYQQQLEVSEIDHLETVQQMNKKKSLYDYGSHNPS